MTLLALGINHNTAALDVRERVAFSPEQVEQALQQACNSAGLKEMAILSTCNRTEIYAVGDAGVDNLLDWLAQFHQLDESALAYCHYAHTDEAAIEHMMKVSAGLDSLVLGEPQILGQMKSAYAVASSAGTVGGILHSAFQRIFSIAKRVRTETAIGENPVSVAYAAVTLAQQIFSDLKEDTALLIGAGETIELVARHLKNCGIANIIVANRTLDRARTLADDLSAEAILLAEIPEYLHRADIVISSTASQLPLLGKGAVESALKQRRHKPICMVDIAVPRDIEAEVAELDDVYLYTVDDLQGVIDENRKSRQQAAEHAERIIADGVALYSREMRALSSVATIKAYRQKAETVRDTELDKALRALESGADASMVLNQLARNLTNKLIHSPTTIIKGASASGRSDMVGLARELFELNELNELNDLK